MPVQEMAVTAARALANITQSDDAALKKSYMLLMIQMRQAQIEQTHQAIRAMILSDMLSKDDIAAFLEEEARTKKVEMDLLAHVETRQDVLGYVGQIARHRSSESQRLTNVMRR